MGVPLITGDKVINDTWSTVILTEMRAFDLLINGFFSNIPGHCVGKHGAGA